MITFLITTTNYSSGDRDCYSRLPLQFNLIPVLIQLMVIKKLVGTKPHNACFHSKHVIFVSVLRPPTSLPYEV